MLRTVLYSYFVLSPKSKNKPVQILTKRFHEKLSAILMHSITVENVGNSQAAWEIESIQFHFSGLHLKHRKK